MTASSSSGVAALLNDPRDTVFLGLMAQCFVVMGLGVGLYFVDAYFWWFVLAYYAAWGLGVLDRFILMLHCTAHRPLFRKEHGWMNEIIPWMIGPFMGQTPNTYFAHHIGMHHIEDNLHSDLSSTMRYRRDSVRGWLHYFGSFILFGLPMLGMYHWRRGSKNLFWRMVRGEATFWITCALLAAVDARATAVVFVIPVFAVRALMMAGNWGQHAFIDPAEPAESWRSSITCINVRYNVRCFNDGFHTQHHKKPRMHYTEHPHLLERQPEEYGRHDALVFDGIDFFQVWVLLMLKQHRALARRLVQLPGAPLRTEDERVALIHHRLQPLPAVGAPSARSA